MTKEHSHYFYDAECDVCVRKEQHFKNLAAKKELAWTTEYPTQPGFYWLRNYVLDTWRGDETISGPEIVQVDKEGDFRRIYVETTTFKHWVLSAEWFGPIQPPADKEGK